MRRHAPVAQSVPRRSPSSCEAQGVSRATPFYSAFASRGVSRGPYPPKAAVPPLSRSAGDSEARACRPVARGRREKLGTGRLVAAPPGSPLRFPWV